MVEILAIWFSRLHVTTKSKTETYNLMLQCLGEYQINKEELNNPSFLTVVRRIVYAVLIVFVYLFLLFPLPLPLFPFPWFPLSLFPLPLLLRTLIVVVCDTEL
jgi:hypothetical protein